MRLFNQLEKLTIRTATNKHKMESEKQRNRNFTLSLLLILFSAEARCFIRVRQRSRVDFSPEMTQAPEPTKPTPLGQSSTISIPLEWKKLNNMTSGFLVTGYALNTEFETKMVLNLSNTLIFLGAVKVDGEGKGGWGIPDCTRQLACISFGPQNIKSQGKLYTGTKATTLLNFTKEPTPRAGPGPMLNLVLVQLISTASPYPLGPYDALGIGPFSAFWQFWRRAYNPDSRYVEFSMSYSAKNPEITNVILAPEGAFDGSTLDIKKKTSSLYGSYNLERLKSSFALSNSSFGIKKVKPGAKTYDYTNFIGTKGCVYPDGVFYFAAKNKTKFEAFDKEINMALCSQQGGCPSTAFIEGGTEIFFMGNISTDPNIVTSNFGIIKPQSYLVRQGSKMRSMVIHSDDLFTPGAICDGADFAVGRLFLFE